MKRLTRDSTIVVIICVAFTLFCLLPCCRADEQPATQYLDLAHESLDKGLYGNALVNLARASSLAPDDQEIALQVQAYSEAHFQLSRNFPQLNSQMSVGDNVLVILNDQVIEIGAAGKTVLTEAELKALGVNAEVQTGARPDAQANPGLLAMLLGWLGMILG